MEINERTCPE
ncbi:hypothetical protein MLY37_03210 [Escherichia coli]|nr:hypothetical protein [Escherichia coli]MCN1870836.1 hypothetical protein [Escherichia coli]MCN2528601.1 hypothetical protein [Escherichia coli]MCN2589444.1 hypothetical protein [Escherichia coli]MCN2613475.1 hypothetical protein [Escherichia coli]